MGAVAFFMLTTFLFSFVKLEAALTSGTLHFLLRLMKKKVNDRLEWITDASGTKASLDVSS